MSDSDSSKATRSRPSRKKLLPPMSLNAEESANRLGMGQTKFRDLVKSHPFYSADSCNGSDKRWSDELLTLIEFARRITSQGVRELTDDEGMQVRMGMSNKRRLEYLGIAEEYACK